MTPEESAAHHLKVHRNHILEHEAEARDNSWAPQVEAAFSEDLMRVGEAAKFRVTRVDCRNISCTAGVEWPTYDMAVDSYEAILHADYKTNCGREILLPEPQDRTAPYRATSIFHCESARVKEFEQPSP